MYTHLPFIRPDDSERFLAHAAICAAKGGHLDIVKWTRCWTVAVANTAARAGHLHIVKFLAEQSVLYLPDKSIVERSKPEIRAFIKSFTRSNPMGWLLYKLC
jgi:hypothetical protein